LRVLDGIVRSDARNGQKRAKDRRIVDVATGYGRGRPYISPLLDSRRLIERFASWIYICVDRNATEVSQHPLRLYSTDKEVAQTTKALSSKQRLYLKDISPRRTTREAVEIEDHPFLDVLDYVNPILDISGLWWLTTTYLLLEGNAYWHLTYNGLGMPIEIWPLPAQFVWPVLGPENVIDKYQLRFGGRTTDFPSDEIVHFRKPSPLDMVSGMAPLRGILTAAETNLRMREWENAVFTHFAVPDLLIAPKGDISEPQQKQLQADWTNTYGGWRNRGKFAVAPFDLHVEKLMLTAKDLQFDKGRKVVLEEIAAGFGVPMNVISVDGITFNNMRHGLQLWTRNTIKPLQRLICEQLNTTMMPMYGGESEREVGLRRRAPWFVAFDNPVPEDVDADAERLVKLSGGIPLLEPNEARAELGREAVDWGDEPFIPGGVRRPSEPIAGAQFPDGPMVDGESVGDNTEAQFKVGELMSSLKQAVDMKDEALANILREKIAELLGEDSIAPIAEIKPATSGTVGIVDPDEEDIEAIDGGDDDGTNQGQQEQEKEKETGGSDDTGDDTTKSAGPGDDGGSGEGGDTVDGKECQCGDENGVDTLLRDRPDVSATKVNLDQMDDDDSKDQAFIGRLKSLLDQFSASVRESLVKVLESAEDVAGLVKEKLLAVLFERSEWTEKVSDVAYPFMVRAFEKGGALGIRDLGDAGVAFEVSLILPPDQVEKHVRRLTDGFASTVVDVTGDDVFDAISEGLNAGENVDGISKRVAAVYGEKKDSSAERIARTELNRALNAGVQETWVKAGIEENEWLASVDACEFCTAMNGKRAKLGQPFLKDGASIRGVDGGTYTAKMGDVLHPTLHPNCTCTIVPVVED